MKSISKYLMSALVVLFSASCEEAESEFAAPQTYPQEEAITIPGFHANSTPAINLDTDAADAKVFSLSDVSLPEGFALGAARIVATPVEGEAQEIEIATDADGMVSVAELQSLVLNTYGKRPVNRTFKAHVYVNAVKEGQAVIIDAGVVDLNLTPKAPQISDAYYLIGDIEGTAWDVTNKNLKFSHSGKDVYEDAVFVITVPVAEGENWFAITDPIAIEANDWSKVFGCVEGNGNNGMTGKLARRSDIGNDGSFKVVVNGDAKFIRITLDMMEYTYKIEKLNFQEYLWVAGSGNGWAHVDMVSSPNFDGNYTGFMNLGNEFKFCSKPDWKGTNYGAGFSTAPDAANMTLPEGYAEGYYKVDMSLAANTLSLTPISTIGVIGDATANGWNASTPLTYNAAARCWEGDVVFTDGEFKFRANDGWDISWGGELDNLSIDNGSNIRVAAGAYHIALYPNCPGKAYCTLDKK